MKHNPNVKIVAFVGLPGAGKSSAVDYVKSKHYPNVYFGGVILDAMKKAGIEHTEAAEKQFREEIRAKEGKDFVAKHIATQISNLIEAGQNRIIADGLYTWTEYKYLKREFPGELKTIAIVAPKHIRHRRLNSRPVRPLTTKEASERDWAEIENLEKGGPIAVADYYIHNESSLESLHKQIDLFLREINFYES